MPTKAKPRIAKRPKGKLAVRTTSTGSVGRSAKTTSRDAGGWREKTLERMRALIQEADPEVIEEMKWRKPSNAMQGVPVWSHDGIICTGETYKDKVKLTFAKGASLEDPTGLFNSGFAGGTRRAIDIYEGQKVDARALKALVKAAVAMNASPGKKAGQRGE
jgi:hypothetical protein